MEYIHSAWATTKFVLVASAWHVAILFRRNLTRLADLVAAKALSTVLNASVLEADRPAKVHTLQLAHVITRYLSA